MDREKVITDIEQQIRWIEEIECHKFPGWLNVTNAMRDALALLKEQPQQIWEFQDQVEYLTDKLKEQEAVEPEVEVLNEIDKLYRCPRCHKHFFYEKQKYCDQCGQAVKWE